MLARRNLSSLAYNTTLTIATGNIIRGNFIGSETDSLISWGIQIEKAYNTIIENNIIENIKTRTYNCSNSMSGINSYCGHGRYYQK